jgi:glycosyltransferase involved in cell wall biosynthesis
MSAPSLSILLAVHNGAPYLAAMLDSLFAAAPPDAEVIAVDDGSTDESCRILERYPLALHRCLEPVGLAGARNLGLARANSALVTFVDQDDIVVKNSFADRMAFLAAHPEIPAVAGCIADVIGAQTESLGDFYTLSGKRSGDYLLDWESVRGGAAIPGALWLYLFRTAYLRDLAPFEAKWETLTDQELLYRAIRRAPIPCRTIPVARYRIHGTNATVRWTGEAIGVVPRVKALGAMLALTNGIPLA